MKTASATWLFIAKKCVSWVRGKLKVLKINEHKAKSSGTHV